MKIIKIKKNKIDKNVISQIADFLKKGRVIVYPTETFYGLGCDAANAKAIERVYKIKGRSFKKPLPVIAGGLNMVKKYFRINQAARKLAAGHWPGPLSIVLDLNERGRKDIGGINYKEASGGVRVTSHALAAAIAKKLGRPIVSTSANPSGQPAALDSQTVIQYFTKRKHRPDFIMDYGKLPKSKGSTFVDARVEKVKLLRKGDLKIDCL